MLSKLKTSNSNNDCQIKVVNEILYKFKNLEKQIENDKLIKAQLRDENSNLKEMLIKSIESIDTTENKDSENNHESNKIIGDLQWRNELLVSSFLDMEKKLVHKSQESQNSQKGLSKPSKFIMAQNWELKQKIEAEQSKLIQMGGKLSEMKTRMSTLRTLKLQLEQKLNGFRDRETKLCNELNEWKHKAKMSERIMKNHKRTINTLKNRLKHCIVEKNELNDYITEIEYENLQLGRSKVELMNKLELNGKNNLNGIENFIQNGKVHSNKVTETDEQFIKTTINSKDRRGGESLQLSNLELFPPMLIFPSTSSVKDRQLPVYVNHGDTSMDLKFNKNADKNLKNKITLRKSKSGISSAADSFPTNNANTSTSEIVSEIDILIAQNKNSDLNMSRTITPETKGNDTSRRYNIKGYEREIENSSSLNMARRLIKSSISNIDF